MTRHDAARTYRNLRAAYLAEQHRGCTRYGTRATVDSFDEDAARYLSESGINSPTPADFVDAARFLLDYVKRAA